MREVCRVLCVLVTLLSPLGARAQVSRAEVIRIAESYMTMRWTPTEANAFHGLDAEGIRVETPDVSFAAPGVRPGWWVPGQVNEGMPYQWGGFCTPEQFREAIKKGLYAGDIYTADKRQRGDAAVSKSAAGIDCSGLVSRCFKLDRPYSTRELPSVCVPLKSFDELQPGDILNSPDNHVLIFKSFTDATRTRMLAYEAGSPPTWKVLLNSVPLSMMTGEGFRPLRFRGIIE